MAEMIDDDTKQFLAGACVFAGLVLWHYWDSSFVVSYRTGVDLNKVVRLAKPKDCDWTFAPLGDKGCSYKATIVQDSEGRVWVSWMKAEDE